jgi:DNA-binding NarL/FixJ family response regulator
VTRVLVVDDHPLFRDGLSGLLATVDGMEVVGAVADGESAVRSCADLVPDIVLMDLNLPGMSGLDAIRRILHQHPDIAVLVLTMVDDDDTAAAALRVGARGYLLKGAGQEEVLAAIHTVGTGGLVLGKAAYRQAALRRDRYSDDLTEREAQVLGLLASGASNAEIARELRISLKTVQNHVSRILAKLQVDDRTQAALRARGF